MPDDRTFVTELATALGMLGDTDLNEAVKLRSSVLRISGESWDRLEDLTSGRGWSTEAQAAYENGVAFLESSDAFAGAGRSSSSGPADAGRPVTRSPR